VTGPHVVVESPGDLAVLITQLHKEDPAGQLLVAVFTVDGVVAGTAGLRMTDPPDPNHLVREVTKLIGLVQSWDGTKVAVAGFGPASVADPYLDLADGLIRHMAGLPVWGIIRVHDGRVWSYTDPAPEYGRDGEGEEYDPLSDRAIETATVIARAELGETQ